MDIKKFGLGLALTAAFGLMACGDDSSSGPSGDGDSSQSCKVIDDGKTIGFDYNMYGNSMKSTTTFNSDGSITEYMKAVYRSQQQIEAVCAETKAEMGDENFDSFKCENGTMEYEQTIKDADYDKNDKAMMKYVAESKCAEMLGEEPPEKPKFDLSDDEEEDEEPSSSNSGSKEDAEDSGDDDYESPSGDDEEFTSPVEEPSDDEEFTSPIESDEPIVACNSAKSDDKWILFGSETDGMFTGYFFKGTTAYLGSIIRTEMGSSEDECKAVLAYLPEMEGREATCDGGIMVTTTATETYENADRDELYEQYQSTCHFYNAAQED